MSPLRCPICKKVLEPPRVESHSHFPFCSRSCQLLDLGRWMDEKYRLDRPIEPADLDDETGTAGDA